MESCDWLFIGSSPRPRLRSSTADRGPTCSSSSRLASLSPHSSMRGGPPDPGRPPPSAGSPRHMYWSTAGRARERHRQKGVKVLHRTGKGNTHPPPGPRPPLVVRRGYIPTAVPRVIAWLVGVVRVGQLGLVAGAIDRLTRDRDALLLCSWTIVWVTDLCPHLEVVGTAHHLPGRLPNTTGY